MFVPRHACRESSERRVVLRMVVFLPQIVKMRTEVMSLRLESEVWGGDPRSSTHSCCYAAWGREVRRGAKHPSGCLQNGSGSVVQQSSNDFIEWMKEVTVVVGILKVPQRPMC